MSTRIGPALDSSPPFAPSALFSMSCHRRVPRDLLRDYAVVHVIPADEIVPAELGGYRVVRILGRSARTVTALIHADGESRVARIFRSTCHTAAIDAEVAVHDAIRAAEPALSEHVATLHDIVTLPDGRLALVLEHVASARLTDLLATRAYDLTLGEAITILAPLAGALEIAHARGVTGLGLDPTTVRLSATGAPVIIRLRHAVAGPALPQRFRAVESAYCDDLVALEHLASAVGASLREPQRSALLAALRPGAGGQPISHALFDLAEPAPLRQNSGSPHPHPSPLPPASVITIDAPETASSFAPGADELQQQVPSRSTVSRSELPSGGVAVIDVMTALGLPQQLISAVSSSLEGVAPLARKVRTLGGALAPRRRVGAGHRAGQVRPRFAVAGAVGFAALVVALIVASGSVSGADHVNVHGPSAGERLDRATTTPVDNVPAESSRAPEDIVYPEPAQWAAIIDELVDRWLVCRVAEHATCAAAVVHAGSAAEALISAADSRHQLLENWRQAGGESVVVERMGGAVLVDLLEAQTTTASLLVVRSEAGWRVRDVLG